MDCLKQINKHIEQASKLRGEIKLVKQEQIFYAVTFFSRKTTVSISCPVQGGRQEQQRSFPGANHKHRNGLSELKFTRFATLFIFL
jgi:hypothetical protein